MSNEVHIHEIMNFMIESGKTYTESSLKEEIHQRYGADVTFCSCSMQGLSAEQAIEFMAMRGKFVARDQGFFMPGANACSH
jgi:probable metal-binding protein